MPATAFDEQTVRWFIYTHAVGIGQCLGMVHVEFIEVGGENVQIVNDLIFQCGSCCP